MHQLSKHPVLALDNMDQEPMANNQPCWNRRYMAGTGRWMGYNLGMDTGETSVPVQHVGTRTYLVVTSLRG
jgi:hypothetical protein